MQTSVFLSQIKQNLAELLPFSQQAIRPDSAYFAKADGTVGFFIAEIEKTAEALLAQQDALHSEIYAERLLKQFEALHNAVKRQQTVPKTSAFRSSYRFPPHIHRLPPPKRLAEYRKAHRALSEKISWLIQKLHNEQHDDARQALQDQLYETEYRKAKCQKAIDELEETLLVRT